MVTAVLTAEFQGDTKPPRWHFDVRLKVGMLHCLRRNVSASAVLRTECRNLFVGKGIE